MSTTSITILGILGIILGSIWVGIGMQAGQQFYDTIMKDWWINCLERFKSWIKHFHKVPHSLTVHIRESVRDDFRRLP